MEKRILRGIVTATITPVTGGGKIDTEAVGRFCAFQERAGIDGLFVNGSTGEFAALSYERQREAAAAFVAANAGRLPLVIQVGAPQLSEALENVRFAAGLDPDGLAAVPPYYFRYDPESLVQYYRSLCEAAPELPFYVYNIPGSAGNDITPELLSKLAGACPTIVGIKDTTHDFMRHLAYMDAVNPEFATLMGNDTMILPALVMGGKGAVSAVSATFPELITGIRRNFEEGDFREAARLQRLAAKLRIVLVRPPIQSRRKASLALRDLAVETPCPPLRELTDAETKELEITLNRLADEFDYPLLKPIQVAVESPARIEET
jgi:4-hydroxy-tetrahydrodipicolinate synthase